MANDREADRLHLRRDEYVLMHLYPGAAVLSDENNEREK